ncbi:MAG: hypothetical protein QXO19_03090 [Candidatus Aenigmatarchaeota archaeon]
MMCSIRYFNSNHHFQEDCYFPKFGIGITLNDVASIINAANNYLYIFKKEYQKTIQEILNEKKWVEYYNSYPFLIPNTEKNKKEVHGISVYPCHFLSEKEECMISSVRPKICRIE